MSENILAQAQMIGNLPTAVILGVIVIVLGYQLIQAHNNGIVKQGEKLDKIKELNEREIEMTRELNSSIKMNTEAQNRNSELLLKVIEKGNENVVAKLEQTLHEIRGTKNVVNKHYSNAGKSYKFSGGGIKLDD